MKKFRRSEATVLVQPIQGNNSSDASLEKSRLFVKTLGCGALLTARAFKKIFNFILIGHLRKIYYITVQQSVDLAENCHPRKSDLSKLVG